MSNYKINNYKKGYTVTKNGWSGKSMDIVIIKSVDDSVAVEDRFKLEDRAFAGYEGYIWHISSRVSVFDSFSRDINENVTLSIRSKFDPWAVYSTAGKTLEIGKLQDVRGFEIPKDSSSAPPKVNLAPADLPEVVGLTQDGIGSGGGDSSNFIIGDLS